MLTVTYAQCHIKTPYVECRYAECCGALELGKFERKKFYDIDTRASSEQRLKDGVVVVVVVVAVDAVVAVAAVVVETTVSENPDLKTTKKRRINRLAFCRILVENFFCEKNVSFSRINMALFKYYGSLDLLGHNLTPALGPVL
jgi:hypothetical protein